MPGFHSVLHCFQTTVMQATALGQISNPYAQLVMVLRFLCYVVQLLLMTAIHSAMQAAQALEPAALVPLQLLAPGGHIVLVGDPKQLPPTVLSRAAESSNLAQSLFERLQQV